MTDPQIIIDDLERGKSFLIEAIEENIYNSQLGISNSNCGTNINCLLYIIKALEFRIDQELFDNSTEILYRKMLSIIGSYIIRFPPTVNAGADQSSSLNESKIFTATYTQVSAPIVSFNWTKISGGTVTMSGITTPQLTVSNFSSIGIYEFKITVVDANDLSAFDTVRLTVLPNNITIRYGYSNSPINPSTFNYQYSTSIPENSPSYELEFPVQVLTGDKYISIDEPSSQPIKLYWYNTSNNKGEMGVDFIMNSGVIVGSKRVYNSTDIFIFDGTNRKLILSTTNDL